MTMSLDEVADRIVKNRKSGGVVRNGLPDDLYLYVRFTRFESDGDCELDCSRGPIGADEAGRELDRDDEEFRGVLSVCIPLSEAYGGTVDDDFHAGDPAAWDRLRQSGLMRAVARYALSQLEQWAYTRLNRSAEMPSQNSVEARLRYAEATAAFLAATSHDANPVSLRQAQKPTPPEGVPVWSIPEPAVSPLLEAPQAVPAGAGLTDELATLRFGAEDKRKHRGKGVLVAVLDTGTTVTHPAFAGRQIKAVDATGTNPSGADRNGHGTGCCGIVGGIVGKGFPAEYEGTAPDAGILSVQVLTAGGWGTDDMIARGVQIARAAEADVISMSLGGPGTMPKTEAQVKAAKAEGVIIVAAAGNDGAGGDTVGYPGRYDEVVCVAATGNGDSPTLAPYSSRGPAVDVCAPGTNVLMPHPSGGWWRGSGTSMATPFIAGLMAVGLAAKSGPLVTEVSDPDDVYRAMRQSARRVPGNGTGVGVPSAAT